jgi:hypothetical protein
MRFKPLIRMGFQRPHNDAAIRAAGLLRMGTLRAHFKTRTRRFWLVSDAAIWTPFERVRNGWTTNPSLVP